MIYFQKPMLPRPGAKGISNGEAIAEFDAEVDVGEASVANTGPPAVAP